MLYWIIWAILWAVGDILYKKSLLLSEGKISNRLYQLLWNFFMIIFLPFIFFFLSFETIDIKILLLLWWSAILSILWEFLEQYSYRNEKISVLVPYGEFETIFTVLFWFFLFADNSIISFIFTIIAWVTLVLWSINFKKLSFNKYCTALMWASFLWAIKYIIYWYVLLEIAPHNALFYNVIITLFILLLLVLLYKDFKSVKNINTSISKYIFLESFTRMLVTFITLFLITELWLVQAVLVWMIYLVFSIFFAFLFLKEKPEKKELFVLFVVFICIALWTFYG